MRAVFPCLVVRTSLTSVPELPPSLLSTRYTDSFFSASMAIVVSWISAGLGIFSAILSEVMDRTRGLRIKKRKITTGERMERRVRMEDVSLILQLFDDVEYTYKIKSRVG